jgi:hypothetical protein
MAWALSCATRSHASPIAMGRISAARFLQSNQGCVVEFGDICHCAREEGIDELQDGLGSGRGGSGDIGQK